MKAAVVLLIVVAVTAHALDVKVTLNVLSGSPDPEWRLSGGAASSLLSLLPVEADGDVLRPIPWYRMGYRGFEVEVFDDAGNLIRAFSIYNNAQAERALLISGNVSESIAEHVVTEVLRLTTLKLDGLEMSRPMDMMPPTDPSAPCDLPVRGPDNGTTYDPQHEVCGFFTSHCSANNCYSYGNDIVTDTFAQPGRGSGKKWSSNTCDDIRASATRDGLVWAGTTLPTENPERGHYVALFIWPGTNFHWIRFDSTPKGYWSHKPGGTPVRNTDNRGQKITDPSKCDFSPWSQFCGYMTTIPSTATIN